MRSFKLLKLLVLLVFICSQASGSSLITHTTPASECEAVLQSTVPQSSILPDVKSEEWLFLTTRHGKIIDDGYLQRLHDGMKTVFLPYLDAELNSRPTDFRLMMRELHRIVVSGLDGKNVYWGASHPINSLLSLNYARPGMFRNEVYWWQLNLRWKNIISIREKLSGDAPQLNKLRTPLTINGIPKSFLPYRTLVKNHIYYEYPPAKAVPMYLAMMEQHLTSALQKILLGADFAEISSDLVSYLQAGINGHIFNKANFSIMMTQVNIILRLTGHRGISPAYLDYRIMATDLRDFKTHFDLLIGQEN